jgi:methylmalonyl-CoA mutase cobalamin-binding domain/chain
METLLQKIRDRILEFDLEGASSATEEALSSGVTLEDILSRGIGSAMGEIGLRYERGEYFVSELVMGGSVVKQLLEKVLSPIRQTNKAMFKGKVVIGTVEGDLHDIGKMIVTSFLLGTGFDVTDLGVDVSAKRFTEAVAKEKADIVAMSCLLTTTLPSIEKVIDSLKAAGMRSKVKVLIGGHATNAEYAEKIGVDGYGSDGPDAVKKALALL